MNAPPRPGSDVSERRIWLYQEFATQTSRDPKAVLDAIWRSLTLNSDVDHQLAVLEQLERALSACSRVANLQQPLFKLELTHACQASGCGDAHCTLCKQNPSRVCNWPISTRQLVDTDLKSQCGARVDVNVVPLGTQPHYVLPKFQLQVCVIEKRNCHDAAWRILEHVALLTCGKANDMNRLLCVNQKSADAPMGHMHDDNFVYFPAADASGQSAGTVTTLPDLILKASGESVVKSKLPELALAVRAVDLSLQPLDHLIKPVFSNPFQVATKRTKCNMKVHIPLITTEVGKIEGIGEKTEEKLLELPKHCAGYDRVQNVGQLLDLIHRVQGHESEKARLTSVLKMKNKESWDAMVAHAQKAVVIDNRMRMFTVVITMEPRRDVGLVFLCKQGELQLTEAGVVGYVERYNGRERFVCWKDVQQMYDVQHFCNFTLLDEAKLAWAMPGHPGWDFYRPANMKEVDAVEALPIPDSGDFRYQIPAGCAPAYEGLLHFNPPRALDDDAINAGSPSRRSRESILPSFNALRTHVVTSGSSGADVFDGETPIRSAQRLPTPEDVPIEATGLWGGTLPGSTLDFIFNSGLGSSVADEDLMAGSEHGKIRSQRSFQLPNSSGSFAMRERKRTNLYTSSELEAAFEANQPASLDGLSLIESWQDGVAAPASSSGPADLPDLMSLVAVST